MSLKYLRPAFNVADAAMDPAVAADPDPGTTALAAPAPIEAPPEPDAAHDGNGGKKPWFLSRIAEESAQKQQALDRAAAFEKRALEAEALAQRLANKEPVRTDPGALRAPAEDRQAEIRQEAARQRLYEDSLEVKTRGISQYGAAFTETLSILNAVGATSDDFISDVLAAADKTTAHVLLDKIAKDPDKALSLAQMNSRQRTAELVRMSVAATPKAEPAEPAKAPAAAAPPKQVSKAPAPAPKIDAGATKVKSDYGDEMSDDEFTALFNERRKARAGGRK